MTGSTGRIVINTISEAKKSPASIVVSGRLMVADRTTVQVEMTMTAEIAERQEAVEITALQGTFSVVVSVIPPGMDTLVVEATDTLAAKDRFRNLTPDGFDCC